MVLPQGSLCQGLWDVSGARIPDIPWDLELGVRGIPADLLLEAGQELPNLTAGGWEPRSHWVQRGQRLDCPWCEDLQGSRGWTRDCAGVWIPWDLCGSRAQGEVAGAQILWELWGSEAGSRLQGRKSSSMPEDLEPWGEVFEVQILWDL